MPTNLDIDDVLLNRALKVGEKKSKKDTVNEALKEYIERRLQKNVVEVFDTIDWDPKYNYKKGRERK